MRLRSILVFVLALAVVVGAYVRRRHRPDPAEPAPEESAVLPSVVPDSPPAAPGSPPSSADVQPTLDHLFEAAVVLDARARPAFLTGDFNGDGVPDLAAVVRPRDEAARERLNGDVPPWRLQDAAIALADPAHQQVRIASNETVLAVVHGLAGAAWSDPPSGPGYLVRNAVGPGMRARPLSDVPADVRMRVSRAHAGDVIAQEQSGRRGVVLWTGAAYVWAELR